MTTFPSAPIHRSTGIGWDGRWDGAQHRSISSVSLWKALRVPTLRWDAPGEATALQPQGDQVRSRNGASPRGSGLHEGVLPLD